MEFITSKTCLLEVDPLNFEYSAGGFVYRQSEGNYQVLMIRDRYGWWTLPKGHIEENETPEEAALREVMEETNISASIIATLPTVYYTFWKGEKRVHKFVHYYLMEHTSTGAEIQPQLEEIHQALWVNIDELTRYRQYENNRPVMQAARTLLTRREAK